MAVVNTKLFIHKILIKSLDTAAVTQAVTCEPVATPVIFFSVPYVPRLHISRSSH